MALNFPTPQADGQLYAAPTGISYRWNAAAGVWVTWGTGTNTAIISSTLPLNPAAGQLWWSDVLGQTFIFFVDANSSQWVPASPSATLATPPGLISDFGGLLAPAGWYVCDGALVSRTTDAPLFAAIGTAHGAGDGSTTFALPDLRGRVTAGKEATPTRLTVAGSGIDGSVLGAAGGAQTHTLTVSQMPYHSHSPAAEGGAAVGLMANNGAAYWSQTYTLGGGGVIYYSNGTGYSGADGTHQNTQPTYIVNKIIKR